MLNQMGRYYLCKLLRSFDVFKRKKLKRRSEHILCWFGDSRITKLIIQPLRLACNRGVLPVFDGQAMGSWAACPNGGK